MLCEARGGGGRGGGSTPSPPLLLRLTPLTLLLLLLPGHLLSLCAGTATRPQGWCGGMAQRSRTMSRKHAWSHGRGGWGGGGSAPAPPHQHLHLHSGHKQAPAGGTREVPWAFESTTAAVIRECLVQFDAWGMRGGVSRGWRARRERWKVQ